MKYIIKFGITILLILFFVGIVSGMDELFIIEDFDSYSEGVSSGSNDFVSWSGHSSYKTNTTLKISTPMSLKCDLSAISSLQDCYINITVPVSVTGGEFWIRYSANDQVAYSIINFINESDNVFIKFRIYHKFLADIDIYDNDSWFTFGQTGSSNNFWGYGWQGNHTVGNPDNYVYYYIKNDTGNIIDSVEKRWISSDGFFGEPLHAILIQTYDDAGGSVNVYYEDLSGIGDYGFDEDIPVRLTEHFTDPSKILLVGLVSFFLLLGLIAYAIKSIKEKTFKFETFITMFIAVIVITVILSFI